MIDSDHNRFTTALLRAWKTQTEEEVRFEIEQRQRPTSIQLDIGLIRFYSQCLDRPAFQDSFRREGSMEAFDKAIEDTITAINTGVLLSRNGTKLSEAKGKSYLANLAWREKMDTIVDLLRAIRSRFGLAVKQNAIHLGPQDKDGQQFYAINDDEVGNWMDETRSEIIRIFSEVCDEAGVDRLTFPREYRRHFRRR
jgi:hypothetical protein